MPPAPFEMFCVDTLGLCWYSMSLRFVDAVPSFSLIVECVVTIGSTLPSPGCSVAVERTLIIMMMHALCKGLVKRKKMKNE
jgi:hypothetical protein